MRAISSVYGFILIFLLSMASVQTWSSAVGAMESIQGASDQSHEVQQLQSIEHLSLSLSGQNLTIVNDGQVPSTVDYLRLIGANSSRIVPLDLSLEVGQSAVTEVGDQVSVEVVTALGNLFMTSPAADPLGSLWSTPAGEAGGNAQLFDDPYAPSLLYVSSGSRVFAFTPSGNLEWSFDAGDGQVTDVMAISGGFVYVSVDYGSASYAGMLFELTATGQVIASYSVRAIGTAPSPYVLPEPSLSMGDDSGYVYYDGWFYGPTGVSVALSIDYSQLAATDASSFYMYVPLGGPNYGSCEPWGNEEVFNSYHPGQGTNGSALTNWIAYAYAGPCTGYEPQLVSASANDGLLVTLFAAPYYSDSLAGALPGYDPYIIVLSGSGSVRFDAQAPTNGYASVATDGSNVYLSLPELDEVQVLSLATNTTSTYNVGFAATDLICSYGHVFAISRSEVRVYDEGSMQLVRTIELATLTLSSFSNSINTAPAMHAPSFLVLNGTTYAALVVNATGFSNLIEGDY